MAMSVCGIMVWLHDLHLPARQVTCKLIALAQIGQKRCLPTEQVAGKTYLPGWISNLPVATGQAFSGDYLSGKVSHATIRGRWILSERAGSIQWHITCSDEGPNLSVGDYSGLGTSWDVNRNSVNQQQVLLYAACYIHGKSQPPEIAGGGARMLIVTQLISSMSCYMLRVTSMVNPSLVRLLVVALGC